MRWSSQLELLSLGFTPVSQVGLCLMTGMRLLIMEGEFWVASAVREELLETRVTS